MLRVNSCFVFCLSFFFASDLLFRLVYRYSLSTFEGCCVHCTVCDEPFYGHLCFFCILKIDFFLIEDLSLSLSISLPLSLFLRLLSLSLPSSILSLYFSLSSSILSRHHQPSLQLHNCIFLSPWWHINSSDKLVSLFSTGHYNLHWLIEFCSFLSLTFFPPFPFQKSRRIHF